MKCFIFLVLLFAQWNAFAEDKKEGLSNETGVGIVLAGGNTDTSTISADEKLSLAKEFSVYRLNGHFLKSSTQGTEQAYQWNFGLRYEAVLSEKFSAFLGQKVESDKYQGINQRYSSDLGGKYFFKKEDGLNWFAELGYRFTRENYPYGFKNINFMRLYHEIENNYGRGLSLKWWFEYLPNLTVWKAYQFNTEPSLSVMLSELFSLKTGYLIRYNNEPPRGIAKKTDTLYTMSLVAKF